MGTLGETEEKKINNEIQKKAETICTFTLQPKVVWLLLNLPVNTVKSEYEAKNP